eukprot:CAMPEP_0115562244 /NCGR_PEP_ID=MMETSP0271-20121206/101405_1 /TAXON_ID=71861 /ORGANISM="Scrippsiella trochoidea, Strain CCMP3099" /LENGTH=48 /DNA_ID= /DNA_START= /DNA_END= /DNA_ORIENTATION=
MPQSFLPTSVTLTPCNEPNACLNRLLKCVMRASISRKPIPEAYSIAFV